MNEFARRVGCHVETVRYAVNRGRILTTGQRKGRAILIDWNTESPKWKTNRLKDSDTYRKNRLSKEGKTKAKKDYNKIERHIGDSTLYDTGKMGIDPSSSRFDDIPEIDGIQAPEGSVAYFQAKKLGVDAMRNLIKLKQETAQLIAVPDAIALYCDTLTQVSDSVQTIPARLTNLIVAEIRKSVATWKTQPENLEAEIYRLLTLQCKDILNDVALKVSKASEITEDFIEENVTGK